MRDGLGRSGGAGAVLGALALVALGCGGGGVSTGTGGTGGTSSGGAGGTSAGGGAGGSFCTSFTECGGSVVGTWGVHRACLPPTSVSGGILCQGQTFDVSKVSSDFTWTFRADLTMTITFSTSGAGLVTTPSPCMPPNGAPVACADVGAMYAHLVFVGAKTSVGACQEANGSCTCPLTFTAMPQSGDGMYSTSGTTLSSSFSGSTSTASYCATPSMLKIMGFNPTGRDGSVGVYDRL